MARQKVNTFQNRSHYKTTNTTENGAKRQQPNAANEEQPSEHLGTRGSSFLETILGTNTKPITGARTSEIPDEIHSKNSKGLSAVNDRQLKTAIVRPQIYHRTFANFRSSSNYSSDESCGANSNTESHHCEALALNVETSTGKDLVPVCKNPKAVVRRRSLQLRSTSNTGGLLSPPPRSPNGPQPNTDTSQATVSSVNSRSLIPYSEGTERNKLDIKRVNSAPISRVLTAMEQDQLAAQFIHVGHRALVDTGKKKGNFPVLSLTKVTKNSNKFIFNNYQHTTSTHIYRASVISKTCYV